MSAAPFVAWTSPARTFLLVIGALAFAVLGHLMNDWPFETRRQPPPGLGLLTMAFFGLCFVIGFVRLFQTGARVRIGEAGIWYRDYSTAIIPWDGIVAAWPHRIMQNQFLCLTLHQPGSLLPTSTPTRWLARWNKKMGYGDVSISLAGTDGDFDAMLAAVDRFAPGLLRSQPAG